MASLFTSQTPASPNNTDGTPTIMAATSLVFTSSGQVTGIRWFCPTTTTGTWTGYLWEVTAADPSGAGTLLASKAFTGTPTGGDWNTITLDAAINVVANTKLYRVGIHSSAGLYVFTSNFFTTALTNGPITAPADGSNPVGLGSCSQGTYNVSGSATYPSSTFQSTNYFADVVWAGDTTPPSVPAGLGTTSVGSTSAGLSWSASSDDVGVTGYELQVIGA